MKKVVFFMLLSLFIFISCEDTSSSNNEISEELTEKYLQADTHAEKVSSELSKANSRLGMKLFEKITQEETGKNVMISPLSIAIAMTMVTNGASGENLTEMKNVLELSDMEMDAVNTQFKELIQSLISADQNLTLEIADSVWIDSTFSNEVKESFTKTLEDNYFTESFIENFYEDQTVDKINKWVSENTNGKIDKIINEIGPDAVMYLINAVYFNANWTTTFDKSETKAKTFYTKTGEKSCDFMTFKENQSFKFKTVEDENYPASVVRLPYGRGVFSFYGILPEDKNTDIDSFIANMKEKGIDTYLENLTIEEAYVNMPKFKFEYSKHLMEIFNMLGMEKAFKGEKAFLNIAENHDVNISDIFHKTYIDVNESGTEAAAVTEVEMSDSAASMAIFNANHPFVFVIRDDRNGAILFMGKVEDPTAE